MSGPGARDGPGGWGSGQLRSQLMSGPRARDGPGPRARNGPDGPGPRGPGAWARAQGSPWPAPRHPHPPATPRRAGMRGRPPMAAAGPSPPGSEATAVAAAGPSPPGSEATAEATAEARTALPPSPPHPSPGDPLGRGQGPGRDDSSPLPKECTPQGASVMYRGSWVHYSWWSLTQAHGFAWTPPLTKYIPVLAPTLKNYILPWVAAAHSGGGERMGEGVPKT